MQCVEKFEGHNVLRKLKAETLQQRLELQYRFETAADHAGPTVSQEIQERAASAVFLAASLAPSPLIIYLRKPSLLDSAPSEIQLLDLISSANTMNSKDDLGNNGAGHTGDYSSLHEASGNLQTSQDSELPAEVVEYDNDSETSFKYALEADDSDYDSEPSRKRPKTGKAARSGRGTIRSKTKDQDKNGALSPRHGSGVTKRKCLNRDSERNIVRWKERKLLFVYRLLRDCT